MKESYTFKATLKDTDFVRICRENHQARFIVVNTAGVGPLTFVQAHSSAYYELRTLGQFATARIDVAPLAPAIERMPRIWLVFEGDQSSVLAPRVVTMVEAYK